MKYKPKTIYCPLCKRKVGTHDGRSTNNFVCMCRKCRKRVVYYPETQEVKIKAMANRTTASGMTFI